MLKENSINDRIARELIRIRRQVRENRHIDVIPGHTSYARQNNFLSTLINTMPAGVIVSDETGSIILANPAANEMLGGEVTGNAYGPRGGYTIHLPDNTPFPPDRLPLVRAIRYEEITGDIEMLVREKSGRERTLLTGGGPVYDNLGQIAGAVSVLHDITEKIREKEFSDALNDINAAVTSTLDFDEIMARVIVKSVKIMGCDSACVALLENEQWILRYIHGLDPEFLGMCLNEENTWILGFCAKTKEPVVIEDLYNDSRAELAPAKKCEIRSLLAIPLIIKEEAAGVLSFIYTSKQVYFPDAQKDFALKLGASVSMALNNARLYDTLHNHAASLQTLLEQASVGIAFLDCEIRFREVNTHAAMITGLESGELTGRSLEEILYQHFGPETAGDLVAQFRHTLKTGEKYNAREWAPRLKQDTGKPFYADWEIRRVDGPDGKPLGIILTVVDVTEQTLDKKARLESETKLKIHHDHLEELVRERTKELVKTNEQLRREIEKHRETEKALRLSEERFAKSFNASPVINIIISLDDGKFIDINENFVRYTGYTREEIMGCTFSDINLLADADERTRLQALIRKRNPLNSLEVTYLTKAGQKRTGLFSAEVLNINGKRCLLAAINDITERKRLENEITRLDKLNLVGEMAAGIGHEIRNPLTTVRGFLQMLSGKKECIVYADYFGLMIEELDRANSIIKEFLSLAKDKALDCRVHNLNHVIEALFPLIQADAVMVNKHLNKDLGDIPDLLFDENEIRQLLLNLVRNGLEAMQTGGQLIIMTYTEGKDVVLAVRDNGKGIDPEVLDKIGTPFFTTKENGTGLGLAVCYSIAARHNALINIDTGPQGTMVAIRFPLTAD